MVTGSVVADIIQFPPQGAAVKGSADSGGKNGLLIQGERLMPTRKTRANRKMPAGFLEVASSECKPRGDWKSRALEMDV